MDMAFNPFVMNSPENDNLDKISDKISNITGPSSFDLTLSPGNLILE